MILVNISPFFQTRLSRTLCFSVASCRKPNTNWCILAGKAGVFFLGEGTGVSGQVPAEDGNHDRKRYTKDETQKVSFAGKINFIIDEWLNCNKGRKHITSRGCGV